MNIDRERVWTRVAAEEPTFLEAYDPTNNYHTVQEIVLGGSTTWGFCNSRYKAQPGHKVLDIGANVGIYSAWCASRGAFVGAYECDPTVVPILQGVGEKAKFEVHPMAVRSTNDPVKFFGSVGYIKDVPFHNGGIEGIVPWTKAENDGAQIVQAVSFEQVIGGLDWDMVKIDIEGGEADILLNTDPKFLKHIKRAYVELHTWIDPQEFQAMIALCRRLWNCTQLNDDALYLEAW